MLQKSLYLRIAANAISYRVPLAVRQVYLASDGFFNSLCPRCHRNLPWEYIAFCSNCGQRLSWIFLDDAEELKIPLCTANPRCESALQFAWRVARIKIKKCLYGHSV